jgi:hypothetical protein
MSKRIPSNILITILISLSIIAVFLISEYFITKGQINVPLDDVYIHFEFSRNLANGKGFSFIPGNSTPGSTSPLWTILLSILYFFLKNHILISKLLSAFFYIASGILMYLYCNHFFKKKSLSLTTTIMFLLTGRFAWSALSGMEITSFTTFLLLFLLFNIKRKPIYLQSFILGVASLLRPEGYILFVFFIFSELIINLKKYNNYNSMLYIINSILLYIIIIIPYLAFSYKTTGNLLPNTFLAQSISSYSVIFRIKLAFLYLFRFLYLIFTDNPIIAIGIPYGIYNIFRYIKQKNLNYLVFILITLGFPLIESIIAPNLRHHGRYIMPFIPIYTLIGFYGIYQYFSLIKKQVTQFKSLLVLSLIFIITISYLFFDKKIFLTILIIMVMSLLVLITANKFKPFLKNIARNKEAIYISLSFIYLFILLGNWAYTFGYNVKNINDMHVKIGYWVKESTSCEDQIALHDIGAITYISQRNIIDMVGLVSPDVLTVLKGTTKENREEPLWNYLKNKKPEYIIIIPSWYPNISQKNELTEVYRIELDKYTIVDGEMVVYKTDFD